MSTSEMLQFKLTNLTLVNFLCFSQYLTVSKYLKNIYSRLLKNVHKLDRNKTESLTSQREFK